MAIQCRPEIVQDTTAKKWYIVTSWHKPGHPKTKYDVTSEIHSILKFAIDQFVKEVEKEHKASEIALTKAEESIVDGGQE